MDLSSIFATMRAFHSIPFLHFPMAHCRISLSSLEIDAIPEKFLGKESSIEKNPERGFEADGSLDLIQVTKQRSMRLLFFKISDIPLF